MLLAACGPGDDAADDDDAATDAVASDDGAGPAADDAPAGHSGGVPLPPVDEVPPLDLERRAVPLEDVVFNTFDGGFLRLADATEQDRAGLRDRIPPIERPVYVPTDEVDFLDGEDLVLGYETDAGQPYAYPLRILNFHEIVNDELDGTPVLVTYCPLCRSGVVYDRRVDGEELTFGNTSALLDNDLVMYDHQTNSYWWQIAGRAVVGELTTTELTPLPSRMAAWADWRERHPGTLVLSTDTGFSRPYQQEPFTGYQERVDAGQRPFPDAQVSQYDDRLPDGEEVLGVVIDDAARAYPLRALGDAVVNDEVAGTPLLVVTREEGPSGAAFERTVDGRVLTFGDAGGRLRDEETGTTWDLDGRALEGPLAGERLTPIGARTSFWFAFIAAFPDADVATSAD